MDSKQFFNKAQAVAVLYQIEIEKKTQVDVFQKVDINHKYFSLSSEELEKKLMNYLNEDVFAGVIDQPV